MKIWTISDLHRTDLTGFEPPADFDALVVAGDVTDGDIERSVEIVAKLAAGREAIFVAGNHEYWGNSVVETIERGRAAGAKHGVHFLECDVLEIGGVRFAGTTLWEGEPAVGFRGDAADPIDIGGPGALTKRAKPADIRRLHERAVAFLTAARADVFVTHYPALPLMAGRSRPALWLCGHLHTAVDFEVVATRIIFNPVGFVGQETGYVPRLVIDVPFPAPVLTP